MAFTGEEAGGRYLDLHPLYQRFLNSKWRSGEVTYAEFVTRIATFDDVPRAYRTSRAYRHAPFPEGVPTSCFPILGLDYRNCGTAFSYLCRYFELSIICFYLSR